MEAATDKTYNGWTNYETWAVGMFLSGNYDGEGVYREVLDIVRDAVDGAEPTEVWTKDKAQLFAVEDALKDYTAEMVEPTSYDGLRGDLIGAALSEVDWRELAENKIQEISET